MKRYGNIYEKICDMDNLIEAHHNARKGKSWYHEIKVVNDELDTYLRVLQQMLLGGTYRTSEYEKFYKQDGVKQREIYKLPYFPDRICQWAIMQQIEPILIKQFVRDTYSAIPKRGIHLALQRIQKAIKDDPEGTKYCLQMDIHKFYPSIDHRVMKKKFRKIFKDKRLLNLLDEIIDSVPESEGIPIGNYMSQYCGNYYLSDFDHWVKETEFVYKGKKYKVYYFRYMDDMIILCNSKEFLHWLFRKIEKYMMNELHLTIKNNWQIYPIADRGIDFIGYRIFPDHVLLRKRTVKAMKKALQQIRRKVENNQGLTYHDYCCVNSYLGWIKPCNNRGLLNTYFKPILMAVNLYYFCNLCNKEEKMKQFLNAMSTVEKPQSWSDEFYTYVLIKQESCVMQEGTENETNGFIATYNQYTHEEFQELMLKELKEQALTQLDQTLSTVKANKIAESKKLLEKYYEDNPLFSTVHKESGEYYAVTSEKQNYLLSMITLVEQSKALGYNFKPTWNATGEACEEWTETELKQLSLQMAQFVYPAVSQQQTYEKQIQGMDNVEDIQNLVITYGTAEEDS